MTPSSLIDRAAAVLADAAARAIAPRFRALARHEIEEKAPGELVTVADRDAEAIIAAGLAPLVPDARVVGEEACAADPRLLATIAQGRVWIVDPLDGTANFAAGDPHIAVMAALLEDGVARAALILDPLTGRLCVAEAGAGAWIDGARLATSAPHGPLRGVIGRFMPPEVEQAARNVAATMGRPVPTLRAAGAEYPRLALGDVDYALFWRTLAWDHAAGTLFLAEAGGRAAFLDGAPWYAGRAEPLLLARDGATWQRVREAL